MVDVADGKVFTKVVNRGTAVVWWPFPPRRMYFFLMFRMLVTDGDGATWCGGATVVVVRLSRLWRLMIIWVKLMNRAWRMFSSEDCFGVGAMNRERDGDLSNDARPGCFSISSSWIISIFETVDKSSSDMITSVLLIVIAMVWCLHNDDDQ